MSTLGDDVKFYTFEDILKRSSYHNVVVIDSISLNYCSDIYPVHYLLKRGATIPAIPERDKTLKYKYLPINANYGYRLYDSFK